MYPGGSQHHALFSISTVLTLPVLDQEMGLFTSLKVYQLTQCVNKR